VGHDIERRDGSIAQQEAALRHQAREGTAVDVRTYQAYSMSEALSAVKRDLGVDAVILSTRSFRRGGIFGLWRRTIIEVTARRAESATAEQHGDVPRQRTDGRDTDAERNSNALRTSVRRADARRAYGSASPASRDANIIDDTSSFGPTADDRERTRRLALAIAEQHDRRRRAAGDHATAATTNTAEASVTSTVNAGTTPGPFVSATADGQTTMKSTAPDLTVRAAPSAARRFVLRSSNGSSDSTVTMTGSAGTATMTAPREQPRATVERFSGDDPDDRAQAEVAEANREALRVTSMHNELAAIRTMVGEVLQRQSTGHGRPLPAMPQQLFDMYLQLVSQDLTEDLADTIIDEVRGELGTEGCEDEQRVKTAVRERLSAYIPCAATPVAPQSPDGRPLTVALIGPTGVGKTTTLAKLAASFKLRHGRSVGLITADSYRIAAVDQLRTYANIIGLPLEVALTPADMRQAVHALSDCDVILIDTAGRSQRDHDRLNELRAFLDAAAPHEVHLVLSSTASEKVLLQESEAFASVGADKVVLTKLDEAVSFGMLINVIRRVGKELSFFTTGQEVPDHIELGRSDRLAELILGGELHT